MSAYLDSLLGAARLAECRANAIQFHPKEQAMKHHATPARRAFADAAALSDVSPLWPFRFTIIRPGKRDKERCAWFLNALDANLRGAAISSRGCQVLVSPMQMRRSDALSLETVQ